MRQLLQGVRPDKNQFVQAARCLPQPLHLRKLPGQGSQRLGSAPVAAQPRHLERTMAGKNGGGSQEPQLVDILISRGSVITMDPGRRVLDSGSVAVHDGKIVAVGPSDEIERLYRGKKTLDARRKTVMPGLHDLHSHAGVELVKGVAERYPGPAWRNITDFISYHTSPEWWRVEGLLSALQ